MKILGIGGVAQAGKDSFFQALQIVLKEDYGISSKRYAFADELKRKANSFVKKHTSIDLFNSSKEQKEIVRPLMVSFGEVMRTLTRGRFWVEQVENQIWKDKVMEGQTDLVIITDVRFSEYPEDETEWVKKDGGLLLHVTRYNTTKGGQSIMIEPANEAERKNDPSVLNKSDLQIIWPSMKEEQDRIQFIREWKKLPEIVTWVKS